jgi:hypothetical protein
VNHSVGWQYPKRPPKSIHRLEADAGPRAPLKLLLYIKYMIVCAMSLLLPL